MLHTIMYVLVEISSLRSFASRPRCINSIQKTVPTNFPQRHLTMLTPKRMVPECRLLEWCGSLAPRMPTHAVSVQH
jgi:hypothetical protein